MQKFYFVVILGFLSLLVAPSVRAADTPWLKIGYVTDLTGIGAFFGTQSQRGAILAQKDFSKAKQTVQIIFEDSAGSTANAVTAVIKLLEQDKVDAVLCDLTSVCTAISGKVRAAHKPLIYHSPSVSIRQANIYAYRNFIDYTEACQKVAQYWKRQSLDSVGSLIPNIEFGEVCLDGVKKVYPGHFTYRYNPGDDLRTAVSTFRLKKIKAVMHVGFEKEFLQWFKIGGEQHYAPIQGLIEIVLSDAMRRAASEALENSTVAGYADMPADFVERLNNEVPGKGDFNLQGAALAYNAVQILAAAFVECPTRAIDCLDSALRKKRPEMLLGFSGWHSAGSEYAVYVKSFKNGKLAMVVE